MKPIPELQFGFRDAENYRRKDQKDLFNKIFVRTYDLDRLCKDSIYFLLGEKGTGKTALSMYLNNNEYKNILSSVKYIRETDYQKFVILKKERHLTLSDYTSIWKVIIYLLMSEKICDHESDIFFKPIFPKFKAIKKAIDEYYKSAFTPEILQALDFIEKSEQAAKLISKYLQIQSKEATEVSFTEKQFQMSLFYIKKQFENSLNSLKLKKSHILFIDGIDIRPKDIEYEEYLDCIKGLANAVWEVNSDFFSSIKDSTGRMRVVLLMRPDIFVNLGLQNMNNKFGDNSVLLDWRTTYQNYRNSAIFEVTDKLLESQQDSPFDLGECWNYYFPFKIFYKRFSKASDDSFVEFLRYSLSRPRDIIAMLEFLQMGFIQKKIKEYDVFNKADLEDNDFKRRYSEYRLGEIKDHLSFYYSEDDFDLFFRFFTFLDGKFEFKYNFYLKAYNKLIAYIKKNELKLPVFCETADTFLQFLFNANVIGYIEYAEDEIFFRWCYRERDYANMSPKVKVGVTYRIHYGLSKSLNVGKDLKDTTEY